MPRVGWKPIERALERLRARKMSMVPMDRPTSGQWIDVKERLPESGKRVLVRRKGLDQTIASHGACWWLRDIGTSGTARELGITHWKPLSELEAKARRDWLEALHQKAIHQKACHQKQTKGSGQKREGSIFNDARHVFEQIKPLICQHCGCASGSGETCNHCGAPVPV